MNAFTHSNPLYRTKSSSLNYKCTRRKLFVTSALAGADVLAGASLVGGGCWSWGNKVLYQYTPGRDSELQAAFNLAVLRGISLFDTGDSYGTFTLNARSEQLLGKFLAECPVPTNNIVIATKCASYPWRITRRSIRDAVARSAERLGRPIDLAQIHWSVSGYAPWQERVLWDGFADALKDGNARAIGVSNFGVEQLLLCADYMEKERGVKLCSVQAQFSLLSRYPLETGLVTAAKDRGISVIGYSPLCLGLLAGQSRRSRGFIRDNLFYRVLRGAEPLQTELARVGEEVGASQAQVAIAWSLSKGVYVLTGIRTEKHALEASQSEFVRARLSGDQIERLEVAAQKCPAQMVQNIFQTA